MKMRTKYKVICLLVISCVLLVLFGYFADVVVKYFNMPIVKYAIPVYVALPYILAMSLVAIFSRRSTFHIESPIPKISRFNPAILLSGAIMLAAAQITAMPVERYIPDFFFSITPYFENMFSVNGAYAMATFVIITPVCQEWFFRGMLQNNLTRIYPKWLAISITACIYLVFNLSASLFITILLTQIMIGMIYDKYKSLSTVIGIHMLFNGITYLFFLLTGSKTSLSNLMSIFSYEVAIGIWSGAVILLILFYGIYSKR